MSENQVVTTVDLLSKIGVTAESAEDYANGLSDVALTIGQYSKLTAALPETELITIRGARVIARVNLESLNTAVENRVKAPRTSAGNVTITSRTVYTVDAPEAANEVTEGWWDSDSKTGMVTVNGTERAILEGIASDFYEVAEDGNPERPVFHLTFNVTDEKGDDQVTMTAYSVMNLIKRICAMRVQIVG